MLEEGLEGKFTRKACVYSFMNLKEVSLGEKTKTECATQERVGYWGTLTQVYFNHGPRKKIGNLKYYQDRPLPMVPCIRGIRGGGRYSQLERGISCESELTIEFSP